MTKVTAEKMTKAARNAKHVSIKAKDLRGLVFVARSQSNPNESYEVRLALVNGVRHWECTCRGYERFQYCKHTFAAVVLVLGIKKARKEAAERAEKLAATETGEGVASEPEPGLLNPVPATTDDEIDAQRVTICPECGEETTLEPCIQHPLAPDKTVTLDELIEQQRDRETKRDLFRRLLDERLAEDARPKTLHTEMLTAPLIRPEPPGVRFGSMQI